MKAAVIHAFGQPPRFEDFPDPTATDGEALVQVAAAGLHPVVKALASGAHYGSSEQLPLVPGVDGVGRLHDGTRVYFGGARPPYGTMSERTVVPRSMCIPLPDGLDDATTAALVNPGMSGWLALSWRAQLVPGETVLVLGATGVAGQLAVQLAKRLGAGRVIAAGRDRQVLASLGDLGADATIHLDQADHDLTDALASVASDGGVQVVVDYLWGHPTEALIAAISRRGLTHAAPRVRLIEVGDSAGPTITLAAQVLRSSGLEILGSGAGTVPLDRIMHALPQFIARVASGELQIGVERIPLTDVEQAWQRDQHGRRLVLLP
jgi:NADPH:quinone reductase-like Zn-dependent oxidoreductase